MRPLLVILISVFVAGCGSGFNRGATSGQPFTTEQPKNEDVAGSYLLVAQSVTTNGISVLRGRECRLDLKPDGAFSITNYINWGPSGFLSTSGRWKCEIVGSTGGHDMWGVRFDSDPRINDAALSGKNAPYRIVMIFGDPDSDQTMIFEKR
jgi:hypothetical protein